MMKKVTWVALLVSILGAVFDRGGSDGSTVETVAELAMMAKMLAPADDPASGTMRPATGQPAATP